MRSRLAILVIAIILALSGTVSAAIYLQNVKAQVEEGGKLIEVLVARKAIPAGTSTEDLTDKNLIVTRKIPKKYAAEQALSSTQQLKDKALIVSLSEGEQLIQNKFQSRADAELSFRIPPGLVAISIPVDEIVGVSNSISPGDRISVIATFSPGSGGTDVTRIFLQNIEVLSTSASSEDFRKSGLTQRSALGKKTVILALTPADAEKLVFAEEKGNVWLVLLPRGGGQVSPTPGQTLQTIFE